MPATERDCGCKFDSDGSVIELCAAHRPKDEPMRVYTCGACGGRGHNSRSCGMTPEQRRDSRRGWKR
jgi:hypothetical protein